MTEHFAERLGDGAEELLREYFEEYSGAYFETYGENDPYRIGSDDLIAVTMLSISVGIGSSGFLPAHALAFESRREELAELLRDIPSDVELRDLEQDEARRLLTWDGSPVRRLYDFIRHNDDDHQHPGRVASYKLLARKRPSLLAVRDSVVERALDHASPNEWWLPWWEVLQDPAVSGRLAELHEPYSDRASMLRIADILVWMRERGG